MRLMHIQQADPGLRFIVISQFNIESWSYDFQFGKFDKEIRDDINKAITQESFFHYWDLNQLEVMPGDQIETSGMNLNWMALLTETTKTHCSGRRLSYTTYSTNFFTRSAFMSTIKYIKR